MPTADARVLAELMPVAERSIVYFGGWVDQD